MQKIAVFHNQYASHSGSDWTQSIKEVLFRSELRFFEIPRPRQLKNLMSEIISAGTTIVICIGGDGSMNLMIQHLANTGVGFLLIPAGTANDQARELGILKGVVDTIYSVRKDSYKTIDLVKINGHLFATNGGIGLGSDVTEVINRVRSKYPKTNLLLKLFKHKIYTLVLSYFALRPKLIYYNISLLLDDGTSVDMKTPFVFILNQSKIAGSVEIVPDSSNDDGLFHIVAFSHQDRVSLLKCFAKILMGDIPCDDPDFHSYKTARAVIEVTSGQDVLYFGDGEVIGKSDRLEIDIVPRALNVYLSQKDIK
jgi:diacylglycerol kinase (ATP)